MATATPVNAVTVTLHYPLDNDYWLETDCADYEALKVLPQALQFEGRTYGRTGWNSDRGVAYYSTAKAVATF